MNFIAIHGRLVRDPEMRRTEYHLTACIGLCTPARCGRTITILIE